MINRFILFLFLSLPYGISYLVFAIPCGNPDIFCLTPMEFCVVMCKPFGITTLLSHALWKFHYPQPGGYKIFLKKSPIQTLLKVTDFNKIKFL